MFWRVWHFGGTCSVLEGCGILEGVLKGCGIFGGHLKKSFGRVWQFWRALAVFWMVWLFWRGALQCLGRA